MKPSDTVHCERYASTHPATTCAARCLARQVAGNARHNPRFHDCATCPIGLAASRYLQAQRWTPPRRSILQISQTSAARRRWQASLVPPRENA